LATGGVVVRGRRGDMLWNLRTDGLGETGLNVNFSY
jgi:hypothetical protein